MARHQQRPEKSLMQCSRCSAGDCQNCMDVTLILLGRKPFCACEKKGHDGEPRDKQVMDPTTGTVVSTGAVISIDGDVTIHRAKLIGED